MELKRWYKTLAVSSKHFLLNDISYYGPESKGHQTHKSSRHMSWGTSGNRGGYT